MDKRVKGILDSIVEQVSGDVITDFMQKSLFGGDVPMTKWSMLNQFICFISGTQDSRGYRQWQKVGRYVKKGSKAIFILAPLLIKTNRIVAEEVDGEVEVDEKIEEVKKLIGFKLIPVFRYEDTDGKPLEYAEQVKRIDPEELPLYNVAKDLGISINVGLTVCGEYGSFCPSIKEIRLCTDSEQVFLHELSHAIDEHLRNYKITDYGFGEVVAELSACFLASLYGLKADLRFTQNYIKSWSKGKHVALSIGSALERVKAIYSYIEKWELSKVKSA